MAEPDKITDFLDEELQSILSCFMGETEAKTITQNRDIELSQLREQMSPKAAIEVFRLQQEIKKQIKFSNELNYLQSTGDKEITEAQEHLQKYEKINAYKKIKLGDLIISQQKIRPLDNNLSGQPENSLYIMSKNPFDCHLSLDKAREFDKKAFFLELVLNNDISNKYLRHLFSSEFGQAFLLSNSRVLAHSNFIDFQALVEVKIPVPGIFIQNKITQVANKVELLQEQVNKFKNDFALNPKSKTIVEKVDKLLEISNSLTKGEELKSLIFSGETTFAELKQTFNYDIKTKETNPKLELSCIKTIAGFLNKSGGKLLIGVVDPDDFKIKKDINFIPGIQNELVKRHNRSLDKFKLYIVDKIKVRIGTQAVKFIEIEEVEIDDEEVLVVTCDPSDTAVYVDGADFYARQPQSTQHLKGKQVEDYIKTRFK